MGRRLGGARAPPAGDHRPVRRRRPADGRRRARADGRLQRLHLQLPRAARRAARRRARVLLHQRHRGDRSRRYHRWGERLRRPVLVGMFAFAVVERDSGRLVLARDRLGIKPLYLADVAGAAAVRLDAAGAAGRRRRRHRHRPGGAAPLPDLARGGAGAAHDPARRAQARRRPPCWSSSPTAARASGATGIRRSRATPSTADWSPRDWEDAIGDGAADRGAAADGRRRAGRRAALRRPRLQPDRRRCSPKPGPAAGCRRSASASTAVGGRDGDEFALLRPGRRAVRHRPPPDPGRRRPAAARGPGARSRR